MTACARVVICPSGGLLTGLSSLISDFPKNISIPTDPKSNLELFASRPTRGAYRDRHGRGMGCGGRGSVLRATCSAQNQMTPRATSAVTAVLARSGKHILTLSSSQFDSQRTFRGKHRLQRPPPCGDGRTNFVLTESPASVAALGRGLERLQHLVEREAADLLALREFLERCEEFPDVLLRRHEQEGVFQPPTIVVDALVVAPRIRMTAGAETGLASSMRTRPWRRTLRRTSARQGHRDW